MNIKQRSNYKAIKIKLRMILHDQESFLYVFWISFSICSKKIVIQC